MGVLQHLAYQVNTRNTALPLLGIDHPAERTATLLAIGLEIDSKRLGWIGLAALNGLHDFIGAQRGKNIFNGFSNQVLGAVAKVSKERFVAENQFSFGSNK